MDFVLTIAMAFEGNILKTIKDMIPFHLFIGKRMSPPPLKHYLNFNSHDQGQTESRSRLHNQDKKTKDPVIYIAL